MAFLGRSRPATRCGAPGTAAAATCRGGTQRAAPLLRAPLSAGTSRRVPVPAALRRRLPRPRQSRHVVVSRCSAPPAAGALERSGTARRGRSASHRAGDAGSAPPCGRYPERRAGTGSCRAASPSSLLRLLPIALQQLEAQRLDSLSCLSLQQQVQLSPPSLLALHVQGLSALARRLMLEKTLSNCLKKSLHHIDVEADNHMFVFLSLNYTVLQLWRSRLEHDKKSFKRGG